MRPLTAKQVKAVQAIITKRDAMSLLILGRRHKMRSKTVSAYLEIAPTGEVQRLRIEPVSKEKDAVAFRKALSGLITSWTFPKMKQAGACTVKLTFPKQGLAIPAFEMVPPGGWHKHEMAPRSPKR